MCFSTKTETTGNVTQTTTPTPEEERLNQLEMQRQEQLFEPQLELQEQSLATAQSIIGGGEPELPGFFKDINEGVGVGGISDPERFQLGDEFTSQLVGESLEDLATQAQFQGLLDSGVTAALGAKTSSDIRRNVAESNRDVALGIEEFNASNQFSREAFNIGNLFNLLNLGVGGQAQVQQPILANANLLSQRLAGLRTTNQQSSGTKNVNQGFGTAVISPFMEGLGGAMAPK